jgi:DNA modification methylase
MTKKLIHPQSFDDLPAPEKIEFGELLAISLSASTSSSTHGLHRYPAKFIPQIPRWAIRNFTSEGDIVLDPFAGSGTTLVEALAEGRTSIGVDLDPMACLISQAKTAKLDPSRLASLSEKLLLISNTAPAVLEVPLTGVVNFGHWFSSDAWSSLQALRSGIDRLELSNDERAFLLVVFSSILRTVSNADDQTQKTYVSGTHSKSPPPVFPTFVKKLSKAIDSANNLNRSRSGSASKIITCSATDMPLGDGSVDLIATSPPYLDSVDYMYNLMLEYFWLGPEVGINSRKDFNERRRQSIGAKQPYFCNMSNHFVEAARVLKTNGRYVLVVGNSRTQAGMVPVHDALVALAADAGLHIEHAFAYRIRRHYMKFPRKGRGGIILMDWVITLRKGEPLPGVPQRLPLFDEQLAPDEVAH